MNREEFMERLEELLEDVPQTEKADALQYYNDYLDDAGKENENAALAVLGSPESIADSIRIGLQDGEEFGEFTESGFRMDGEEKREPVPVSGWTQTAEEKGEKAGDFQADGNGPAGFGAGSAQAGYAWTGGFRPCGPTGSPRPGNPNPGGPWTGGSRPGSPQPGNPNQGGPWTGGPQPGGQQTGGSWNGQRGGQGPYNQGPYNQGPSGQGYGQGGGPNPYAYRPGGNGPAGSGMYGQGPVQPRRRSAGEIFLLILAAIFLLPILVPLGLGAVIVAFTFLVCVVVFFACLVVAGICVLVVGGALISFAVANLAAVPSSAVCILGGGLVCVGLGLLLTLLMVWLAAKTVPALCRSFVSLCSLPFRRKK